MPKQQFSKAHQLKKGAEGDAKPKGETSTQGRKETPILDIWICIKQNLKHTIVVPNNMW